MSDQFLGEIRMFPGKFVPRGWAFCQGQILNIMQSSALFSLLGVTYGGNGTTTFALPNFQGNAPMHWGNGVGLTPRSLGETGGTTTETINMQQMPAHNHLLVGASEDADLQMPDPTATIAKSSGGTLYNPGLGPSPVALDNRALGSVGGSGAHNNMQMYLPLNFCIAMEGIFPQRP